MRALRRRRSGAALPVALAPRPRYASGGGPQMAAGGRCGGEAPEIPFWGFRARLRGGGGGVEVLAGVKGERVPLPLRGEISAESPAAAGALCLWSGTRA